MIGTPATIDDGDAVIFFNFRADLSLVAFAAGPALAEMLAGAREIGANNDGQWVAKYSYNFV